MNRKNLFHLPWNSINNRSAWLEPTNKCNLNCIGCYRKNLGEHKPFSKVKKEIDTIIKKRNCENITIAGGEPLLYPHLEKTIKHIKSKNLKVTLLTNGVELTLEKAIKLRQIGLHKITVHIDSRQNRPGWNGKNELELNELREYYTDMAYEAGIKSFGLIMTVHINTLKYVPDIILWAQRHVKKLQDLIFVCYRLPIHITYQNPSKNLKNQKNEKEIYSSDIFDKIHEVYPDLNPHSYLNGTIKKDSLKWLISTIICTEKEVIGYLGYNCIKYLTLMHFKKKGKYPAFSNKGNNSVKLILFGVLIDNATRKCLLNYLKLIVQNPIKLFSPLFEQTFIIIQPHDVLSDGRINMCNGCPDATIFKNEMVPSCRLEEYIKYGQLLEKIDKKIIGKVEKND